MLFLQIFYFCSFKFLLKNVWASQFPYYNSYIYTLYFYVYIVKYITMLK